MEEMPGGLWAPTIGVLVGLAWLAELRRRDVIRSQRTKNRRPDAGMLGFSLSAMSWVWLVRVLTRPHGVDLSLSIIISIPVGVAILVGVWPLILSYAGEGRERNAQ